MTEILFWLKNLSRTIVTEPSRLPPVHFSLPDRMSPGRSKKNDNKIYFIWVATREVYSILSDNLLLDWEKWIKIISHPEPTLKIRSPPPHPHTQHTFPTYAYNPHADTSRPLCLSLSICIDTYPYPWSTCNHTYICTHMHLTLWTTKPKIHSVAVRLESYENDFFFFG